jgi:hypothetical protein
VWRLGNQEALEAFRCILKLKERHRMAKDDETSLGE